MIPAKPFDRAISNIELKYLIPKRKTQNQIDGPNQKGYRNERGKLGRNTFTF